MQEHLDHRFLNQDVGLIHHLLDRVVDLTFHLTTPPYHNGAPGALAIPPEVGVEEVWVIRILALATIGSIMVLAK